MKNLKNIGQLSLSIVAWMSGLFAFTSVGLTILLLDLFLPLKSYYRFVQLGCRMIVRLLFIRVSVKGLDFIQKGKTYLFMSNHVNIFDVFVLYGYIPHFMCGIELEEHFRWPFYGAILRRLGSISISRTKPRDALKSLNKAQSVLNQGISITILPEGGRTLDGQFKSFKRGAFLLAKRAKVDIVPMVMIGAFKIKRKGSLLIRPGKLVLRFGVPILFQDIEHLEIDQIKSFVHQKMVELFNM